MKYLFLVIAIVGEVIGTTLMKQSDGFTKLAPSIGTGVSYLVCFYFLSLTMRELPTGIVYAMWSGCGIVLIAGVAWLFQGQKLDLPALVGIGFIIVGVAIMNLLSKTGAH